MEDNLISVIMGVYYCRPNTALLERSVRSLLDQTFQNLEILICDDGSSNDAMQFLDQIAQQDRRIRLIRPGGAYSLPCKLNVCLKYANGNWIGRMDDDDYSHPERLEKQLKFLQEHDEFSFVGCNVNLVQEGRKVGIRSLPERPSIQDFYFVQPFIHPALLFRKDALMAVDGYSEDRHCILCEDYDLLLRMYTAGYHGANLQEQLLDYSFSTDVKGKRRMKDRWNEAITRYRRFRELGVLGTAWPYVVKPVAVGLIPANILGKMKKKLIDRA